MKIYCSLKSKNGNHEIKFCGIRIYEKQQINNMKITKYLKGFIKNINDGFVKKIYILGIKCYTHKNEFKALENELKNLKIHMDQKLQEYKVKQQKMFSVVQLHSKVFPQFKAKHIGQSIAIIGSGPTLNYYVPDNTIKYIALNRSISYTKIHFDYFFCVDGRDDNRELLKKYSNYECIKFYGQHFNFTPPIDNRGCANIPESDALRDNAYRFYSNAFDNESYQDIATCPLMDYGSVAFCAINFALYTFPSKIYLVGCDCTMNGYFNNTKQQPWTTLNKTLEGYKKLKIYVDTYYPDTEIISVNPVGLKGMFRDVYTQSYVNDHPELLEENVEILQEDKEFI